MSGSIEIKGLPDLQEGLKLCQRVGLAYEADAAGLVYVEAGNTEIHIFCGRSWVDAQVELKGQTLNSQILGSVLQRNRPLRLMDAERHPELTGWTDIFELDELSNLMLLPYPKLDDEDQRNWALVLIRQIGHWQYKQQTTLEAEILEGKYPLSSAIEHIAPVSAGPDSDPEKEKAQEANNTETPESDLGNLEQENQLQKQEILRLLDYIDQKKRPSLGNGSSKPKREPYAQLITDLEQENELLRQELSNIKHRRVQTDAEASGSYLMIKEELRLALNELASLYEELRRAEVKGEEQLSSAPGAKASQVEIEEQAMPQDKAKRLAGIAQEMRQPLSSIMGYTDLLLGESVGILGAMQRKFLERVHSSTTRIDSLVEDLIQVTEIQEESLAAQRSRVRLSDVIDPAIANLSEDLQRKNILLRVDIPRNLPSLETDRDALQQIIFHLMQNAYQATPEKEEVFLQALNKQQDDFGEYLLLQVRDSGGGIAEEDVARVFSRVYRAQNPDIGGVGDSGVGLAIAETLTKALGGRIWVESKTGMGATFSVLLPIQTAY